MKSFESIAREAYEVFCGELHEVPLKMLAWKDLPERTRNAWIDTVRAIVAQAQQVH